MRVLVFTALTLSACSGSGQLQKSSTTAKSREAKAASQQQSREGNMATAQPAATPPTNAVVMQQEVSIGSSDSVLNSGRVSAPAVMNAGAMNAEIPRDDAVVAPNNVTGAYLHCANLMAASDNLPTATVGCRMDNEKGEKILAADLGDKVSYSFAPLENPNIKVMLRINPDKDATYDALYTLSGNIKDNVNRASENLKVAVDVENPKAAVKIEVASGSVSETKADSKAGWWMWICNDEHCEFVDQATGYRWSSDQGGSYTQGEAVSYCENLVHIGKDNWRLPSAVELQVAYNNFFAPIFPDKTKIRPGLYWSSDDHPTVANSSWTAHLQSEDGNSVIGGRVKSERHFAVCIRD